MPWPVDPWVETATTFLTSPISCCIVDKRPFPLPTNSAVTPPCCIIFFVASTIWDFRCSLLTFTRSSAKCRILGVLWPPELLANFFRHLTNSTRDVDTIFRSQTLSSQFSELNRMESELSSRKEGIGGFPRQRRVRTIFFKERRYRERPPEEAVLCNAMKSLTQLSNCLTLVGSFSSVSTVTIARKGAFCSIF